MIYPMPSSWSFLEIVGALTVALFAYTLYKQHYAAPVSVASPLPPLPPVRAPAAVPQLAAEVPVHIKRSLPPSTPLAIQQQPSTFGDMFQQIGKDVMNTLFKTTSLIAPGR